MRENDSDTSLIQKIPSSRRGFLSVLSIFTGLSAFTRPSHALNDQHHPRTEALTRNNPNEPSEIPPYPDDPFMQSSFGIPFILGWENFGYENVKSEQIWQTVLHLHPDVLAFDQLLNFEDGEVESRDIYQAQFALAQDLRLPATSGMNVHIEAEEEEATSRYGPILEESEWEYPDGTQVTSPIEIIGESFDGEPHITEYEFDTLGHPSAFAPGGLELMVTATLEQLEKGYSGFFNDGGPTFRLHGLDFSRWARAAFRTHLESLPEDQLSSFGIVAPESFDIRNYLKENELTPDDDHNDPREDPVFREYLLHHHIGINRWHNDYRNAVKEHFPERMENDEISMYANHFTGDLSNPQAPNIYIYISDSVDVIYTELFPRIDPPSEVKYKIMRSVGNFSKPVIAKGTLSPLGEEKLEDLDPESTLIPRFQVAEACSTGTHMQLPMSNRQGYHEEETITNWVAGDGSVPDELRSIADFLWAHERFLSDLEPAGDIVLIWSLPTQIWRFEPTWNITDRETIDSFIGTSSILREAGYTYDVLTFGHPRLWDDSIQINRLNEYDLVILAGVDSITDDQVDALHTYLDNGGEIVCTDSVPTRDSMYKLRTDTEAIFARDNASVLDGFPGLQREVDGESAGTLSDVLEGTDVEPIRQTDDPDIAVHAHKQSDPNRYIIHLVNYSYEPKTDSFSTKSEINVRLSMVDNIDSHVRYYTPQEITDLEVFEDGGSLNVTVPELVEWGFLVLASTSENLESGVSEASALDTIEQARELLEEEYEETQELSVDLVTAESKVQAAETAASFGAFDKAKTAATEAIEAASKIGAETVDEDDSDEDDDKDEDTTDDDFGGLGIGAALAGVGGAIYLLKNSFSESDTESE